MGPSCPHCKNSDFSYGDLLSIHPYPGEFSPAGISCPTCDVELRVTTKSRLLAVALLLFLAVVPIALLAQKGVDLLEWQVFFLAAGIMIFYYFAIWPYVVRLKPWTAFQYWQPNSRLVGYFVYLLLPVATIALFLYLAALLHTLPWHQRLGLLVVAPVYGCWTYLVSTRHSLARGSSTDSLSNAKALRKSDSAVAIRWDILSKRDEHIVSRIDDYIEDSKGKSETAAILFGAGHMPAIVTHLTEKHGYSSTKAEWVSVIATE